MNTDCRSENGVTVGLIDGIIAICRVLRHRNLNDPAVKEALKDFVSDEDLRFVIETAHNQSLELTLETAGLFPASGPRNSA